MKGKILFVAGVGLGYVLGARAGRERYESIKKSASKVWNNPQIQKQVDTAEAFVKDKAPEVAEFALDGAKKLVGQVRSAQKPASKPAAKKPRAAASTASDAPKS